MDYAKKAHLDQYAKKGISGGSKIVTGFRDFLLRGNVVGDLLTHHNHLRGEAHYTPILCCGLAFLFHATPHVCQFCTLLLS